MSNANSKVIWEKLMEKIGNAYGVAGLMGNLYAESGLTPTNLQNAYERSLGMTDEQYTKAVDNGTYKNFAGDAAGYGLAQWTFSARKENLLKFAKERGASIGDLNMQIDFLLQEIEGYTAVWAVLKNGKSVREVSDVVLTKYERPKDQSEQMKQVRAAFGEGYYAQYAYVAPKKAPNGFEYVFNSSDYVAWLKEQARLKRPYWYGTYWLPCTETLLQKKKKQYPAHYTEDRMPRYRQDIANGQRCADCVNGSIKGAVWSELGKHEPVYGSHKCPDTNADGMFDKCKNWGMEWGDMETMPDVPGIAVRSSGHVGVYVGNGTVVEWSGFAKGCIESQLSKKRWLNWYRLPWVDYGDAVIVQPGRTSYGLGERVLKKGMVGDDVKTLQELLMAGGYDLPQYGADGDFGNETRGAVRLFQLDNDLPMTGEYDEKTHIAMMNAVDDRTDKDDDPEPELPERMVLVTGGRVNVREGASTQYASRLIARKGQEYKYAGVTAPNGWNAIHVGDKVLWISGKYSELK